MFVSPNLVYFRDFSTGHSAVSERDMQVTAHERKSSLVHSQTRVGVELGLGLGLVGLGVGLGL